jgi:FRG domain-containing protein
MAVEIIKPSTLAEALDKLTSLSQEFPRTQFVFRGQRNSQWHLCTSYDRYWPLKTLHDPDGMREKLAHFQSGVMKLRLQTPPGNNQLNWLEYARHHDLAVPLLDFSWSPFVALFFAFDGVREQQKPPSSAVYALNLHQLAKKIAHRDVKFGGDPHDFVSVMNDFLYNGATHLTSDFPLDKLFFIPSPSAYTLRMHAQLGVFLYSTLLFDDGPGQPSNLEEFLGIVPVGLDWPSLPEDNRPILTKIILPHDWASEVFNRLDVIRISGSTLFLSAEGVAKDVYNSYYYKPRAAFLRDY